MLFSCLGNVSDVEVRICANYVSLVLYEGWQKKTPNKTKKKHLMWLCDSDSIRLRWWSQVHWGGGAGISWAPPWFTPSWWKELRSCLRPEPRKQVHVTDALIWCSLVKKNKWNEPFTEILIALLWTTSQYKPEILCVVWIWELQDYSSETFVPPSISSLSLPSCMHSARSDRTHVLPFRWNILSGLWSQTTSCCFPTGAVFQVKQIKVPQI